MAATKPGSYGGGRPPYGYRAQGHELAIDPDHAEIVRRLYGLAREGKSIRDIAALIDADDPTRRWHRTAIERILKRDVYMRHRPGRIVDPRLWHAAQRALGDRRKSAEP